MLDARAVGEVPRGHRRTKARADITSSTSAKKADRVLNSAAAEKSEVQQRRMLGSSDGEIVSSSMKRMPDEHVDSGGRSRNCRQKVRAAKYKAAAAVTPVPPAIDLTYCGGFCTLVLEVVPCVAMHTDTRGDMQFFFMCGQLSKLARGTWHCRGYPLGLGVLGCPRFCGAYVPHEWGLKKARSAEIMLLMIGEAGKLLGIRSVCRLITLMRNYLSRPGLQAAGFKVFIQYVTQNQGPDEGLANNYAVADKLRRFYVECGGGLLLASIKAHPRNEELLVQAIKLLRMILRQDTCSTMHAKGRDIIFAKLAQANTQAGCENNLL
jgi:hypothetical protein